MKDFRTRKQTSQKNFFHSWFFLLILLILLSIFVRGAYASFVKKSNADYEREQFQQEYTILVEKKKELESRIERMKTDRGIEEVIRTTTYNAVREGETMIRILE